MFVNFVKKRCKNRVFLVFFVLIYTFPVFSEEAIMYWLLIPILLILRIDETRPQLHVESAASEAQIRFAEENKYDNTGPGAKHHENAFKTYKTLDEALVAFLDDPDTNLPEQEKAKAIHLLTHLNKEFSNQYYTRPDTFTGRNINIYRNRDNNYSVKPNNELKSFKPGLRYQPPVQDYENIRQGNSIKLRGELHNLRQAAHIQPPVDDFRNRFHEPHASLSLDGQNNIYSAPPQGTNLANLIDSYETLRRASLLRHPVESQSKPLTRPNIHAEYHNAPFSNPALDEPLDGFKYLPPLTEGSPLNVNRNEISNKVTNFDFTTKTTRLPNINGFKEFKNDAVSELPMPPKYQKYGDISLAHFTKNGRHILHNKYEPFDSSPQYVYSFEIHQDKSEEGKPLSDHRPEVESRGPFSLLQPVGALRAERYSALQDPRRANVQGPPRRQ